MNKYISGIDHIALQLPDLDQGLHFFHELLGFKIKRHIEFEKHKIIMLQAGQIEIEMWQTLGEQAAPEIPVYGVHHIAIKVSKLDEVLSYLGDAGVKCLVDVYEPTRGIREAIVQGPGSVRIQLVQQNIPLLIWRMITGDLAAR